ncbi:MAG: peptide ABC transporter substrate-binding protein [Candidatus Eremiobacteraeota bacterium]|nr:peptide ABC transporter substrate-binding protein [Candidatus Eremiobacteraeota bacterium]
MRILSVLFAAALISGCARSGAPVSPREPGSVRFDIAADPANLNPLFAHQDAASVELQLGRLAFEPFIDLDEHGRPQPALLSVIPSRSNGGISPDGRTLTFHLRQGVRWSDGAPVTSADVLFTLRAILDKKNPVRSLAGYELIDRASAPSPDAVVFHLSKAWAPAVQTLFSYGVTSQFVLPKHILEKQLPLAQAAFNAAPLIGDGPFTFHAWQRGEKISYVANPLYWRGVPTAKRLDIRIIPDPSTNLTLLSSGELDWNLIAPAQQAMLIKNKDIVYRTVPTATIAGIAMNLKHAPLNDVMIRRAIAMSIDREAISAKITLGKYPVTNSAQPKFSWAYDSQVAQPGYDPTRADAILDAAGWKRGPGGVREKNGKPLALTYVQFPETMTGVRAATVIQSDLRARGIDIEIKSISNAQLFLPSTQGGTLTSGAYDMAYVPWTMGSDPDDSALVQCHGASNYMRYCNPVVDALEEKALVSGDQAQRKQLYSQIARQVAKDVPIVYLFNAQYVYAYREALGGFSPNAFVPTWNAARWSIR